MDPNNPQNQPQVVPQAVEQRQSPSFFSRNKYNLLAVVVILLALIPLIFIIRQNKKANVATQVMTHPTPTPQGPTPTPVPINQQNAQPTIDATNQNIQNALDQTSKDLNTVSQIDPSQDSVQGL